MKNISIRITVAIICIALSSTVTSAKVKNHLVAFGQEFLVGETLIKAGTYRLSYDDRTSELSILDRKTKAVITRVTVRAEKRQGSNTMLDFGWVPKQSAKMLSSVAFAFDDQVLRITDAGTTNASVR